MRKVLSVLVVSVGATLVSGCSASFSWMSLNQAPRTARARPAAEVEMFTASKPTRPFVEVGLITASRGSIGPSELDMLEGLRAQAATRGCDGVVVSDRDKGAIADKAGAIEYTASVRAVCIFYKEATP